MARKSISREELTPSYEELINELSGIAAKLLVESAAKSITIQKLEKLINELIQESDNHVHEVNNEF